MADLNELFTVTVSRDHMTAELNITDKLKEVIDELSLTEKDMIDFLKERRITYGIQEENVERIVNSFSFSLFPLIIAKGKRPVDGKDGTLEYHVELSTEIDRSEG